MGLVREGQLRLAQPANVRARTAASAAVGAEVLSTYCMIADWRVALHRSQIVSMSVVTSQPIDTETAPFSLPARVEASTCEPPSETLCRLREARHSGQPPAVAGSGDANQATNGARSKIGTLADDEGTSWKAMAAKDTATTAITPSRERS